MAVLDRWRALRDGGLESTIPSLAQLDKDSPWRGETYKKIRQLERRRDRASEDAERDRLERDIEELKRKLELGHEDFRTEAIEIFKALAKHKSAYDRLLPRRASTAVFFGDVSEEAQKKQFDALVIDRNAKPQREAICERLKKLLCLHRDCKKACSGINAKLLDELFCRPTRSDVVWHFPKTTETIGGNELNSSSDFNLHDAYRDAKVSSDSRDMFDNEDFFGGRLRRGVAASESRVKEVKELCDELSCKCECD